MMEFGSWLSVICFVWTFLCGQLLAADILKNKGFTACLDNSDFKVEKLDLSFDRESGTFSFDAAGTSKASENVTAALVIKAYGQEFTHDFDPCDEETKVDDLCPLPTGDFSAKGEQTIPSEFLDKIPSIAFAIPDLEAFATLKLKRKDGGGDVACLQSVVGNGRSIQTPAVTYAAVGIGAASLLLSGAAAAGAGGKPGAATSSPSFGEMVGWFQSMAMNGMLSVNYPPIYRSFSNNFAFSTGLVSWDQMQSSIDNFREGTGGNLTESSVAFLRNATLVHDDGDTNKRSLAKRTLGTVASLAKREGESGEESGGQNHVVQGIQSYVEQLSIPDSNTFMTVLIIFAIVVAAIAVGILLLKVILEVWALRGSFPKKLVNFRKHYWGILGRTIVNLVLILYGIWTLYCMYQFTRGDSWAAKVLAGVTLAIFTAVLGFFTFKIWRIAHRFKKMDGDTSRLFEDKETWRKYSLFYDHYKRDFWWIFAPLIVYLFVRGCIVAGADGHGLGQTTAQLVVEALFLVLLIWVRPFETKSGQWVNISIQIVRVLSVACILVFVHELGVSQTTQTVAGFALVVVQSVLTGLLAILLVINAIVLCFGKNPHEERLKHAEKNERDLDNLTPLDARDSFLLKPQPNPRTQSADISRLNMVSPYEPYRDVPSRHGHTESTDHLVSNADYFGHARRGSRDSDARSVSPPQGRRL